VGAVIAIFVAAVLTVPPSVKANLKPALAVTLPPLATAKPGNPPDGPTPAGKHRDISPQIVAKGQWTKLASGHMLWRLAIRSPQAAALRVRFADFRLPSGEVWVHDGKTGDAYRGAGPNNDGVFWTATTSGDKVVIEYEAHRKTKTLPFRITTVSHLWVE
jgi:hypothetical protein